VQKVTWEFGVLEPRMPESIRVKRVGWWFVWVVLCVSFFGGPLYTVDAERKAYPRKQMPFLSAGMRLLKRLYVDPTQFSSRKMFDKALLDLARRVDAFWYKYSKDKKTLTLRMGNHTLQLEQLEFIGFYDTQRHLEEVAAFVYKHSDKSLPFGQIEQILLTGCLSTLDKQTRIFRRQYAPRPPGRKKVKLGKIGVQLKLDDKKRGLLLTHIMVDGPAQQAGLHKGDIITHVDGVSVKGKGLRELIGMIGGLRGSRVKLSILRPRSNKTLRVVLIRALMPRPNVVGFTLPGQIGYVRLRQFKGGSSLQIREELARLRRAVKGNLQGLILDLRSNPGGRVSEAVNIASLFLEQGDVVTYAGANTKRRTHKVKPGRTEELYPLIVLLNGYSASASELLSGALQNHGRALILGRQSYGKGTVQVMGFMRAFQSLYRVTIAQYMLPGDASIQAVGIAPDVILQPVDLTKKRFFYYSRRLSDIETRKKRWPRFLQQNLDTRGSAWARISYLRYMPDAMKKVVHKPTKDPKRWIYGVAPARKDFEVWFARYLLAHATSGKRKIFFDQIKSKILDIQRREEQRIVRALRALKIDWSVPKRIKKGAVLKARVELLDVKQPIPLTTSFRLRLHVKNTGKRTAYRVRGILFAQNRALSLREFLFGKIPPGKEVSHEQTFTLPASSLGRRELLKFVFSGRGVKSSETLRYPLDWRSKEQPPYTLSYLIVDRTPDGNGDGALQPGEKVSLRFTLAHKGKRALKDLRFVLRIPGLPLRKSLWKLGTLPPHTKRSFDIPLQIPGNQKQGKREAHLLLAEKGLGVRIHHRFTLRITPPFFGFTAAANGWAVFTKRAPIRMSPRRSAALVAWAGKGSVLRIVRRYKEFVKVTLPSALFGKGVLCEEGKKRPCKERTLRGVGAWVHKRWFTRKASGTVLLKEMSMRTVFSPPAISFPGVTLPLISTAKAYGLRVKIVSKDGIRDLYVLQKKKKVFYKSVQYLRPKGNKTLTVTIPLRLKKGGNPIRITVRTAQGRFHRRLLISYVPKET
tara:strand:+ start:58332 stop:61424 length:3093 start_codon:yes stop_codon:yes gene_type:complete